MSLFQCNLEGINKSRTFHSHHKAFNTTENFVFFLSPVYVNIIKPKSILIFFLNYLVTAYFVSTVPFCSLNLSDCYWRGVPM